MNTFLHTGTASFADERGSNAHTKMQGMAFDLSWIIPSVLAHRHEQRFLLHKERNDGGGKRANFERRLLDGSETAKWCGLCAGTRRRVHFHGETRFAHGNLGGATYLLLGFRQNL